jgi:uncharacterized protein YeaO (DUF488 family)
MCRYVGCTTRQRPKTGSGLVDRLWPRGSAKSGPTSTTGAKTSRRRTSCASGTAMISTGMPSSLAAIAPELADPERAAALAHLRELASHGRLTLLTATKRSDISEAAVLGDLLGRR